MHSTISITPPAVWVAEAGPTRGLCYAAVWLTFATSGLVLIEPAPVDALSAGLLVLLPAVGLATLTPTLQLYLSLWLVTLSAQVLGATQAPETARAVMHTVITAHLVLVSICIAAFVAHRSVRHSRLVMDGWLIAAVLAATAAICGYFDLVPGAEAIFTRHERGTGTFKDPNVFGPFLIAPILYVLHLALTRRVATAVPALLGGLLMSAGLLLSFSRGAWLCLAVSVVVWGAITYVHGSRGERRKLVSVCICGALTATVLLAFALQLDEVSRLMEMRASLSQSYDHGPDGRFGGQLKALALVAEHPLGIGSLTFSPLYHHEEAHNVYLSMFMNAGWIGGGLYLVTVLLTIVLGFARLAASGEARPYLTIALATFLAIALEGAIIDSDHWRHFYVLMGLVWGLSTATAKTQVREH